jgi:predicted negative regulator of RcsB-dependent stress response
MSSDASESTLQFDLLSWFELNRKRIVWGIVTVVVAIAAFLFLRWRSAESEVSASTAVLKASGALTPGSRTNPVSSAVLLQLAGAHSGTRAAERAQLLGAGALFAEGKFAESQAQFEAFRQKHGDSPLVPTAAFGVACAVDAQGKTNEAVAAYQAVITQFSTESIANQARLGKARLHEAMNQPEQALALYDELAKPGAFTPSAQEAMGRREALLARNPSLVKPATNAPSLVPEATPIPPGSPLTPPNK